MNKNRKRIVSIIALILAVIMLLGLFISMVPYAFAEKSDDIQEEIDELKDQAKEIQSKQAALQEEIDSKDLEKAGIIDQKSALDREMNLLREKIDNTNLQIEVYEEMIDEKQLALVEARARETELYDRYKLHIRYMEESGSVSYIAILFQANSFSDLLDKMDWIKAISAADDRMMEELTESRLVIEAAQDDLYDAQNELQLQRASLEDSELELLEKQDELQVILDQLSQTTAEMQLVWEQYDEMEDKVYDLIAEKQKEYEEAKAEEEEARRKAEAERLAEEERKRQQESGRSGSGGGGGNGGGSGSGDGGGSTGFIRPISGGVISSPFGMRIHPIYGYEKMHNGVDYDIGYGTPVMASASGYVYWAGYDDSAGNWVMINHSGNMATAYMHLSSYNVYCNQYVTQGQIIGYTGNSGASTGAHLHFSVYYCGVPVNPCSYVGWY